MCLTFPNPFLEIIPSAAVASAYTLQLASSPKYFRAAAIPSPSAVAFMHAYKSDSADDKAIKDCVLDHDFIKCPPMQMAPPL
eukprot:5233062-Karenia_brevis.AAC.1